MFELVLNDQNEIERIDVLRTEVNIHGEEDQSEPSSSSESEGSDHDSDDAEESDGFDSPNSPEGGLWYNGDDYDGHGRYLGRRDW